MRKLSISLAVLASVVAATVTPARAVTGNFTEDNVHNYVGLVAFYDADGTSSGAHRVHAARRPFYGGSLH